nr:unnamed protein product [Digitaria exilis]
MRLEAAACSQLTTAPAATAVARSAAEARDERWQRRRKEMGALARERLRVPGLLLAGKPIRGLGAAAGPVEVMVSGRRRRRPGGRRSGWQRTAGGQGWRWGARNA